jgi:two-component system sensor histidine kinase KdpD
VNGSPSDRSDDDRAPGPLAVLRTGGAKRGRVIAGYFAAVAGTALAIAIFLPFRDNITPLSKGFGFLAIVVAAAAIGGLGPGVTASILGFVVFNFLFIPPYGTFRIDRAEDVVVLFVFLALSVIISLLLARATERADVAEARGLELEALQRLSTDLVAMRPGPDAYRSVLQRVAWMFDARTVALSLLRVAEYRGLDEPLTIGPPGTAGAGGSPGPFEERIALDVGGRNLGLLVLGGDRPPLVPAERRVLMAFAAQLSLMLERDRMLAAVIRTQTDASGQEVGSPR